MFRCLSSVFLLFCFFFSLFVFVSFFFFVILLFFSFAVFLSGFFLSVFKFSTFCSVFLSRPLFFCESAFFGRKEYMLWVPKNHFPQHKSRTSNKFFFRFSLFRFSGFLVFSNCFIFFANHTDILELFQFRPFLFLLHFLQFSHGLFVGKNFSLFIFSFLCEHIFSLLHCSFVTLGILTHRSA